MPETVIKNSIYVINNSSQAYVVNDSAKAIPLSLEVKTEITDENLTSNNLLVTIGAITTYINKALSSIVIPTKVSELTNDAGYITANDVKQSVDEIKYVNQFPEVVDETEETLYITSGKITRLWVPTLTSFIDLSYPVTKFIDEDNTHFELPTAKGVYEHVESAVSSFITGAEAVGIINNTLKTYKFEGRY